MSHLGASGPGDRVPTSCAADGPLDPGRSVREAVECNTARFVTLTHADGGVEPTYLVLRAARDAGDVSSLSPADVYVMPEVQNALAYFGPETETVRVQTQPRRRRRLRDYVSSLSPDGEETVLEFAGRPFDLDVVVG